MRVRLALLAVTVVLGVACGDDGMDPTAGVLRVSVTTTGGDLDLDGYGVTVGGDAPVPVGVNAAVVIASLPTGSDSVALSGVASNCTVSGDNPRVVTLARSDTVQVTFEVHCLVTGVLVAVATTGIDLDLDGYGVVVDNEAPLSVAAIGRVTITRLSPGSHTVALNGAAANCLVGGQQPLSVSITSGQIIPLAFTVTCGAVTGSVAVTATTSGVDPDANGYTVQLDGGAVLALTTNGTVTINGLSAGDHSVSLGGVAGNCTVTGGPSQTVHVTTGGATRDTARTSMQIGCVAVTGSIAVTTVTAGIDPATNSYTVQVDAGVATPLGMNATAIVNGLSAGDHIVRVDGAAGNCTIAGDNPRTLQVAVGGVTRDTARTTFQVTCVAVTGTVAVTAVTTGTDRDPDGYALLVDGAAPRTLATNGTVTVEGMSAGTHSIRIDGVATNCTIAGENPRGVSVTTGGITRDTAQTAFQVSCVGAAKIAFVRSGSIAVGLADGSNIVTTVSGDDPAWSPDGSRIAYTWLNCDYYYGCYGTGLHMMNGDGTGDVRVTTDASDGNATWHPQGAKLAFARYSGGRTTLYVVNADGSLPTPVPLPASVKSAWQPAWSPDGTTLAFTCDMSGGNQDICLVNVDGTNLRRLTSDAGSDVRPAWKPDGTQIAFATSRYSGVHEIAIMNADGSNVTRVTSTTAGYQPAWSPEGAKIIFAAFTCDIYYGCTALGLSVVNVDGSGLTRLTTGPDRAPNWRH
jgi:hypothetical protein